MKEEENEEEHVMKIVMEISIVKIQNRRKYTYEKIYIDYYFSYDIS